MKTYLAAIVSLVISWSAFSQVANEPEEWKIQKARGREIVLGMLFEEPYVHTSKPFYYAGETVWFKAYMKYRTPRLVDSLSRVLYVDLVDDKQHIVFSQTVRIDHGAANGSISLPQEMTPGNYAIRAYTNWMRNYESSAVFVQTLLVLGGYDLINEESLQTGPNSDELKVVSNQSTYSVREKVDVNLDLGTQVRGNFSVSVTNTVYNPPMRWAKDIRNEFTASENVRFASNPVLFRLERGITWVGKFNGDKKRSHIDDIAFVGRQMNEVRKVTPTKDGFIVLYNLDFPGDVSYQYVASRKDQSISGRLEEISSGGLKVDHIAPPGANISRQSTTQRIMETTGRGALTGQPLDRSVASVVSMTDNSFMATPRGWNEKDMNQYGSPFAVVTAEDISRAGSNLADAIRLKIPGYTLTYRRDHWWFLNNRTGCSPNVLEEGRQFILVPGQTIGDWLMAVPTWNISWVNISSFSSSIYGDPGGTINIYYKQPESETPLAHSMWIKGYDRGANFESPDYGNHPVNAGDDLRTTLYWNPNVTVDGSGSFSFYTSDLPGKYRMVIEGMTEDGKAIHVEKEFEVRLQLSSLNQH